VAQALPAGKETPPLKIALLVLVLLVLPVSLQAWMQFARGMPHWRDARWDSAGLAPDPAGFRDAVVQVYAARAWGWKGVFAVHSWIAFKRPGAAAFERFEVVGWGVRHGLPAVRRNMRPADAYWAGNPPRLLADVRGAEAAALIPRIEQAVAAYPHQRAYRSWPGPNSNTFVAHILRNVPEIGIELPPEAIGKDYLGAMRWLARSPSGTGLQLSFWGLFGLTLAREEGIELTFMGLNFGLDPLDLALKLPGLGRLALR